MLYATVASMRARRSWHNTIAFSLIFLISAFVLAGFLTPWSALVSVPIALYLGYRSELGPKTQQSDFDTTIKRWDKAGREVPGLIRAP
jgi:hypothetical protein